jgi:hypothetical protein
MERCGSTSFMISLVLLINPLSEAKLEAAITSIDHLAIKENAFGFFPSVTTVTDRKKCRSF